MAAHVILPDGKEAWVEMDWLMDRTLEVLTFEIAKGGKRKLEGILTAYLRDRTLFQASFDTVDDARNWLISHRDRFFGIPLREHGRDSSF